MAGYKIKFYKNSRNGNEPVLEYIEKLDVKEKAKVLKYIEFLLQNDGYLNEPFSKHIKDKVRELRVDFSNKRHRILYFAFTDKTIILLHAFLKKSAKTPSIEIEKALINYQDVINNSKLYEN